MKIVLFTVVLTLMAPWGLANAQSSRRDPGTPPAYKLGSSQAEFREWLDKVKVAGAYHDVHQYDRYRPSEVADCRSRGNAAFGDIIVKYRVMDDCLESRRLRRAGR